MYRTEKKECNVAVSEYIENYVNVAEFLKYCKECPNYGNVWSCPPYDFSPEDYWKGFSELYLTARKIIFDKEVSREECSNILLEVKSEMSRELYEEEERFPGSEALSAGSCSLCVDRGCSRKDGIPCRYPDKMRYSIESIGGNVGLTVSKLMGIELEWIEEGKLPSYFVLVGGLLKK